jgi:hypothetical protein
MSQYNYYTTTKWALRQVNHHKDCLLFLCGAQIGSDFDLWTHDDAYSRPKSELL